MSKGVDLSDVKANAEARERQRDAQAMVAAQAEILLWDKEMGKAFKGIIPNNVRRQMLTRAADAQSRS